MPALLTRISTGPSSFSICGDAGGAGVVVGDVELEDRNARLGLELVGGFVIAGVGRRDSVAGRLQRLGNRLADAARAARDDCNSAMSLLP